MIPRLLLLCALVALASESAYGVGLGKIELHSALNQRLDADIPLTSTQGLGNDEILPGLASTDEFDKIGLDRPYELTDLRFSVRQSKGGQLVVHITSTKPVVEPFLDFLVEVLWPNGRILREYTVLLDPPVFGKAGVEQLNAPQAGAAKQPATQAARQSSMSTTSQGNAVAVPGAMSNRLEEGSASNGQYGVTGPGDTLWKIAVKVRPSDSVSVQQTMLAIRRANPDAFINDNINLLKAGRVLRIPDISDIRQVSMADAVQEVKSQNDAFQAYKNGGQVAEMDASRRHAQASSGGGKSSSGELRLLASDHSAGAKAAGDASSASASQELQDQLASTREELDKAKLANTELNGRMSDLEDQVKKANELIKLKDDQVAALKAAVQKMQASQAAPPVNTVTTQKSQGSLLTNPYVLIALGLILVGGVAGGLIFMRRRSAGNYDEDDFSSHGLPDAEIVEDEAEEPAAAMHIEEEEEELSPQTSDVIGEAEIYIAYGRFPQAITFLQNAIEAEPTRADIRLKLLEVFVQTEDATAFNLQFEELKAIGDDAAIAQATALQRRIPGAAPAASAASSVAAPAEEEELSFDLDDLDAETAEETIDLSGDIDLDDAEATNQTSEPTISLDDGDLDLDLEADSSEADEELGDLDLDLDLDSAGAEEDDDDGAISLDEADLEGADLELELETAAAETAEEDDDDVLSLDLDDDEEIDLDSELNLDDEAGDLSLDNEIELDLDDDDDAIELTLDDDDEDALDLSDAGELSLDDDDDLELNLDEDASTKLDLARAYIDMGDSDGARSVLKEVIDEGSESEVQEANELLAKID